MIGKEALRRTGGVHYGFGLADGLGDRLGAVLEDVGGDDGVHRHVCAQDQRRHPARAPWLGSPSPPLRCAGSLEVSWIGGGTEASSEWKTTGLELPRGRAHAYGQARAEELLERAGQRIEQTAHRIVCGQIGPQNENGLGWSWGRSPGGLQWPTAQQDNFL